MSHEQAPLAAARRTRSRARAFGWFGAAALLALVMPAVTFASPVSASDTSSPVTVTGTVSGRHAWNPATKADYADAPSVTVDQVTDLTNQVVHVTWQHFTPSSGSSYFNLTTTLYPVTVLECKGTAPADPVHWSFPDFGPDCYPYTADNPNAPSGTGDQVYTQTGPDGSGEAYFHVLTKVETVPLGCDSTHPCSIIVVPNWGGVQPPGTAASDPSVKCEGAKAHKSDASSLTPYGKASSLGQGCSWGDRIVVPLSFAPTANNCPAANFAFAAEGSPMLARAFEQWAAGWCVGSDPLTFDFDSTTNEYLARSGFLQGAGALTSAVDAAIVNQPASAGAASARRFTYAPVANSAISVSYHVDNRLTGSLVTDLTLDARLVAKLVTQSYALDFGCVDGSTTSGPTCDPAVKGNPVSIFDDPEFQRLNPQYPRTAFPSASDLNRGQFLPLVVAGNSDLVHELTSWIAADPSAAAFIRGTPDAGDGMHVNTYYKNEPLPLDQFETLDPGYTAPPSNGTPGQSTMQVAWNPISGLDRVANSLVIDQPSAIDPTLDSCGGDTGVPCIYKRFGAQPPGNRALFAVVGLDDAAADRFPSAKLVNAAGTAVGPTADALAAGLADMTTNPDKITKTPDYTSRDAAQYPLVTTSYAMVPTCGEAAATVSSLQAFLGKVTSSQTIGLDPGQLTPGNVALSDAQRAQAATAASAISAKPCPRPATATTTTTRSTGTTTTTSSASDGGGGSGGGTGSGSSTTSTGPGSPAAAAAAARSSASAAAAKGTSNPATGAPNKVLAAYGIKRSAAAGPPGFVLPLLLIVTALLVIGGPCAFVLLQTGAGAGLAGRLRR